MAGRGITSYPCRSESRLVRADFSCAGQQAAAVATYGCLTDELNGSAFSSALLLIVPGVDDGAWRDSLRRPDEGP